jgi:hypothetical protein
VRILLFNVSRNWFREANGGHMGSISRFGMIEAEIGQDFKKLKAF